MQGSRADVSQPALSEALKVSLLLMIPLGKSIHRALVGPGLVAS
jgi:hypothetical protein